jgi:hypothetical protein
MAEMRYWYGRIRCSPAREAMEFYDDFQVGSFSDKVEG